MKIQKVIYGIVFWDCNWKQMSNSKAEETLWAKYICIESIKHLFREIKLNGSTLNLHTKTVNSYDFLIEGRSSQSSYQFSEVIV